MRLPPLRFTRGITAIHNKSPAKGMQSHTGTVDGALLPSAANTLNGQARRTAKKSTQYGHQLFSKLPPPYCIFVQRDYHSGDFFHIRVSSYLICRLFFTDAIISYSIQKSIVWIVNIYTLFPVFFIHFFTYSLIIFVYILTI